MTCRSRKCVLCGLEKPWSEFADRGRANKTFACIDCLNNHGKKIESKKPVKVKIDPRKLFEGDTDLREHLEIKMSLDQDEFFKNIGETYYISLSGLIEIALKSMTIKLVEEALPKYIEVDLYDEE